MTVAFEREPQVRPQDCQPAFWAKLAVTCATSVLGVYLGYWLFGQRWDDSSTVSAIRMALWVALFVFGQKALEGWYRRRAERALRRVTSAFE